ncbi:MAG: hypothetical protein Q9208_002445 [Pyrenodesmia sp. 3 TL-2023]
MSQQVIAFVEFKAVKAWTPLGEKAKTCLAIQAGDLGRVCNTNGNWTEVMMQKPDRRGWVPTNHIMTRPQYRDAPIKVHSQVASLDLLPTAAYPAVATSPVERALSAALKQIQQAVHTTNQVTFLKDDAKETIGTDQNVKNLTSAIIHGMPKRLFQVLNSGNYDIRDLVGCNRVEKDAGAGIYARIYQLDDGRTFVYIGSSADMWKRGQQHDNATKDTDSRHYNIARKAARTAVIILTRIKSPILYAEQSMILLFGSYFSFISEKPKTGDGMLDWVSDNWQAYVLTKISAVGFQSVGWTPVTSKLGLHGCNVKTPASATTDTERLTWVRMRNREGTVAMIRRRPQAIGRARNEGNIYLIGPNQINVKLLPEDELVVGTQVYCTFEMRLDGRPHDAPLFRLPLVGGFSDWREISSIGLRMEWNTTKGWKAKYVQRTYMNPYMKGKVQHASVLYIQGSAMLAAFRSQIIDNPSEWRDQFGPLRIIDVWFDQKTQAVQVRENTSVSRIPEPTRRPPEEVRKELSDLGFLFVKTGTWPLVHGKTRDSCDSCVLGMVKKFECLGKLKANPHLMQSISRFPIDDKIFQIKTPRYLTGQDAMPVEPTAAEREFGTVDLDEHLGD